MNIQYVNSIGNSLSLRPAGGWAWVVRSVVRTKEEPMLLRKKYDECDDC